MAADTQNTQSNSEEVTLRDIIISIKNWVKYLISRWKVLIIMLVTGIIIGFCYSKFTTVEYQAKATFIVDDQNQSADVLNTLGVLGIGGSENNPGLFSGDNLTWLYTSDRMLMQTLLTKSDTTSGKLLINRFISIDKKIKKAVQKSKMPPIPDDASMSRLSRKQIAILKSACNIIRKDYLSVQTEKNSASIISVSFISKEEAFSKDFTDNLVYNVNSFYITTKIQKTSDQVAVLQQKVDEYNKSINRDMYKAATDIQAYPNANPNLQTIRVAPQRKAVDVQVNSTLYGQMMAQLEAAKVSLAKETPLIQIVDTPVFPLAKVHWGYIKSVVVFGILAFILTLAFLICRKYYNDILKEDLLK